MGPGLLTSVLWLLAASCVLAIVVAFSMPVMWWIDPRLADPNSAFPANWFVINAGIAVMVIIVIGLRRDPHHVVSRTSRQAKIATAA